MTIESGEVVLNDEVETVVSAEVGSFSCCDIWFNVPEDWVDRVTLRLYGRIGAARVLLRRIALSRVAVTGPVSGAVSGLAISLRGRPCSSFELTCQATAGDDLEDGFFYVQLWHGPADLASSQGDDSSLADPSTRVVAATIVGRNDSGVLTEVITDADGRIKTVNDDATVEAEPDTICLRGSDAESAFGFLRLPEVASVPAATAEEGRFYYEPGIFTLATTAGLMRTVFAGGGVKLQAEQAPITVQPIDRSTSGVGYAGTFAAGKGNGGAGGTTTIGANNGGTPGTHRAGDVLVQLGALVSGESALFGVLTDTTPRFTLGVVPTETLAMTVGATCSAFSLNHRKLTGTGANGGSPMEVRAQDGQDQTGNVDNNRGGDLRCAAGGPGTGGERSAGLPGKLIIGAGEAIDWIAFQEDPSWTGVVLAEVDSARAGLRLVADAENQYVIVRTGSSGFVSVESEELVLADVAGFSKCTVAVANAFRIDFASSTTRVDFEHNGSDRLSFDGNNVELNAASGGQVRVRHNGATALSTVVAGTAFSLQAAPSITTSTLGYEESSSASTGGTSQLSGQSSSAASSVGGEAKVVGGAGKLRGGKATLLGGAGYSGNANGGDAALIGGTKAGTGLNGNVLFHAAPASWQSGARIGFVGNADAAPTGSPTAGAFCWSTAGQLVTREPNGVLDAYSYRDAASGATNKWRRKFVARLTTTSTTANQDILTIAAADVPSGNWSGFIRAEIHAYDTASNAAIIAERRGLVRRVSGTTTVRQSITIGTDFDDVTGGGITAGISTTGGLIVVRVTPPRTANIRWTVWADLKVVEH